MNSIKIVCLLENSSLSLAIAYEQRLMMAGVYLLFDFASLSESCGLLQTSTIVFSFYALDRSLLSSKFFSYSKALSTVSIEALSFV